MVAGLGCTVEVSTDCVTVTDVDRDGVTTTGPVNAVLVLTIAG